MENNFEQELLELQSGLISLCMEVTEGKVDKIYAYASIEDNSTATAFNAFFEVDNEIKRLRQLDIDRDLSMQFLSLGTDDLDQVAEICDKYKMPTPTEMKMIYDVKSGNFSVDYKYEAVCFTKTGISPGTVFDNWIDEVVGQK